MSIDDTAMKALVEELADAQRRYDALVFDEERPHERGAPASGGDIAKLEGLLGKPLPRSYRAFLKLHNGWSNFEADGKILATDDQQSPWVQAKIANWSDLWESEDPNPFLHGAIPVMVGESIHHFLVLDPTRPGEDGNFDFVEYDYMEERTFYKDFSSYLQAELTMLRSLIEKETNGMPDGPA